MGHTVFLLQTDMFSLVGTIHVLLFGQYMNVYQLRGQWKTTSYYKRLVHISKPYHTF